MPASRSRFLTLSWLFLLLSISYSCGGPPASSGSADPSTAGPDGIPELTKEIVDERINDARVWDVPPESGTGEPVGWSFNEDEPKEIAIVGRQQEGLRATLILDIKTRSAPRARIHRQLAGQIRTEWELRTGWVMRRWEIVNTENISMKYKDFPKPTPETPQNANIEK